MPASSAPFAGNLQVAERGDTPIHSGVFRQQSETLQRCAGKIFETFQQEGKRPMRYMLEAFRMKEDRSLKNYLEAGFQNGGRRESYLTNSGRGKSRQNIFKPVAESDAVRLATCRKRIADSKMT